MKIDFEIIKMIILMRKTVSPYPTYPTYFKFIDINLKDINLIYGYECDGIRIPISKTMNIYLMQNDSRVSVILGDKIFYNQLITKIEDHLGMSITEFTFDNL